jgi:DNA helicase HerA-like ATPase
MPIFDFDASHQLGKVRAVDTRRVIIQVNSDEDLRRARVGQLVAISLPGALECWLIGMIEKVIKTPVLSTPILSEDDVSLFSGDELSSPRETVLNTVHVALVGSITAVPQKHPRFSRSILQVPEIDSECHVLRDAQLQSFMNVLTAGSDPATALNLGRYTIDETAIAYLDGNKLFQRHAAILGSTGSGKSWTVAALLEQAHRLPSSNLVVFDLHGEYKNLKYASHYRIPGPEELTSTDNNLLFLPYWLLNSEELVAMFVDRGEFSAQNQVTVFQQAVVEEKRKFLTAQNKQDVLAAFTLDSPVPFRIDSVIAELKRLNEERVEGARGDKAGPFNGQFSRLLVRLGAKLTDKRYGFIFQAPPACHSYDAMSGIMKKLMDYATASHQVKIIDFSEVPSEILPVIVGLVARLIYEIQFWTNRDDRQPLAMVCDEAHLYLPKSDGKNPAEQRAIQNFERIAKEGRKYGVGLMVVSQRPSDVSSTILCQCSNVISLRLTNAEDQSTVRRLMPESLAGLTDTLPSLDIGEALVVGDAVLLPSRIKITPPSEAHRPLSATVQFWDEWTEPPVDSDLAKAVENMRRQSRG